MSRTTPSPTSPSPIGVGIEPPVMASAPISGSAMLVTVPGTLAVNTADQPVEWSRFRLDGMDALRLGSQQQPVLEKDGDNLRIDWGYLYLAAPADAHAGEAAAGQSASAGPLIAPLH